ncbi:MAG: hypothetical protein IKC81_01965 [Paludibacteraceae bacterium]|nr:hypothetical protein [Paludibacteraceae bacterium]
MVNTSAINNEQINLSIYHHGFSESTIQIINNFANDILDGKSNLTQFNQKEHAGLCCAGEVLIGAYIVCNYARVSLTPSSDASESKRIPSNGAIDQLQEKLVQEWAEAKQIWFPFAEKEIESAYGKMIAQGAEAKVYYKDNDTSVIKLRTSIYATLERAFESIVLHNALFPETPMHVIGFTRDQDGLFRTILTQPYIGCERLATKEEIDLMVGNIGFLDNYNGQGVNYISERLHLEDMHPANVFVDAISSKPVCIDCIVKFRRN